MTQISARYSSHKFLGGATQGCYIRQVQLLYELTVAYGRIPKNTKVLDWGAGKGHITYLLNSLGFSVTSCDINCRAEDSTFGQDTPIINDNNFEVLPLNHVSKLPFDDSSFDVVVSFGVLEHVQNDLESLKEIHRILRRGGIFYFTFLPCSTSWSQHLARLRGDWYHPRLYSKKDIERFCALADFDLLSLWYGQLFPKNSSPHNNLIEKIDRALTSFTPFRIFATNLEGFLIAK